MEQVIKLNKWANAHTNIAIDLLRVAFGSFLFYKGLFFVHHSGFLTEITEPFGLGELEYFTVQVVPMFHLAGGLMIAIGLLTRLVTAIHIPLLAGAVVVHLIGTVDPTLLIQASIAFVLCVAFFVFGSGKHSLDYHLKMNM